MKNLTNKHRPKSNFLASKELVEIANHLVEEFGRHPEKIIFWLLTYNPNFEGPPCVRILLQPRKSCDMISSLRHAGILDPYEKKKKDA